MHTESSRLEALASQGAHEWNDAWKSEVSKRRDPSLINDRAWAGILLRVSVGLLLMTIPSGSKDLIGGAENLLCALFGYRIGVVSDSLVQPMLNVAARVVRSFKVQCFAAQ